MSPAATRVARARPPRSARWPPSRPRSRSPVREPCSEPSRYRRYAGIRAGRPAPRRHDDAPDPRRRGHPRGRGAPSALRVRGPGRDAPAGRRRVRRLRGHHRAAPAGVVAQAPRGWPRDLPPARRRADLHPASGPAPLDRSRPPGRRSRRRRCWARASPAGASSAAGATVSPASSPASSAAARRRTTPSRSWWPTSARSGSWSCRRPGSTVSLSGELAVPATELHGEMPVIAADLTLAVTPVRAARGCAPARAGARRPPRLAATPPARPGEGQVEPDHHEADDQADHGAVRHRQHALGERDGGVDQGVRDRGGGGDAEGADPPALAAAGPHVDAPDQGRDAEHGSSGRGKAPRLSRAPAARRRAGWSTSPGVP